jgi:hypothetical protein
MPGQVLDGEGAKGARKLMGQNCGGGTFTECSKSRTVMLKLCRIVYLMFAAASVRGEGKGELENLLLLCLMLSCTALPKAATQLSASHWRTLIMWRAMLCFVELLTWVLVHRIQVWI